MRAFKHLNDNESFKRLKKLYVSLNEHGGNGENCVFNFSLFTAWNSLWDFCDLTQSDNSMNELHLRLFISVRCRRQRPELGMVDH